MAQYEGDINKMKAMLNERNKELNDINYDFNKLKCENQNLIEEVKRFANENERLNIIKKQFEQNSTFFKTKTRSHEMELNDLNTNYKNVLLENERLKQNLKIFVDENKAAAQHIKMIESSLMNYQQNAQNVIKEKDSLINQIETLQKYNTQLTDELTRTKATLDYRNKTVSQF